MRDTQGKVIAALMEQLIQTGPEGMAEAFTALFNPAMRMERDRHLGAGRYERGDARQGHANGYKPKKADTPAGTVTVRVPKSRGCDEPFFPRSLERGRRSSRAIMLAIAGMYVQGVSTRDAAKVMKEFGLESLSSTQVSRAAALLDDELEAWRARRLDPVKYLILDARYEKVRDGGIVRDAAILSAIGVGPDGRRRLLGVSAALSEAEVHWRDFLNDLVDRGLRGVEFIVGDDHAGPRAPRRAVLSGATWQRCRFHLAQNAIHHAPTLAIRKRIGEDPRAVWNARDPKAAEAELAAPAENCRKAAPRLAEWMEANIPEGLAVFSPPKARRRRMRTSNPIGRAVQQEIKRRTKKVRVFPNEASPPRLVTAVLAEIDEDWATTDRVYINMENPDD